MRSTFLKELGCHVAGGAALGLCRCGGRAQLLVRHGTGGVDECTWQTWFVVVNALLETWMNTKSQ